MWAYERIATPRPDAHPSRRALSSESPSIVSALSSFSSRAEPLSIADTRRSKPRSTPQCASEYASRQEKWRPCLPQRAPRSPESGPSIVRYFCSHLASRRQNLVAKEFVSVREDAGPILTNTRLRRAPGRAPRESL